MGLLWGWLCFTVHAAAFPCDSLTLAWDPVPDPNIAGYNLYYGVASRVYTNVVAVGNTEQITITGLIPGVTYYLAVTTRLVTGIESAYSDEVVFAIPKVVPALHPSVLPSGQVTLAAGAPPGHTYDVLATQDFSLWQAIGTVTVDASGSFSFTDPDAGLYPLRFYQLHETSYTAPGSLPILNNITPSDTGLLVQISGQPGHTYEILTTVDFQVWGVMGAVTVGLGGSATCAVPDNSYFPYAYYQLQETDYSSAQNLAPFIFYGVSPGYVQILFDAMPGPTYTFLQTSDFNFWNPVTSFTFTGRGTVSFADWFDPANSLRIYRLSLSY